MVQRPSRSKRKKVSGDCVIPEPLPWDVLPRYVLNRFEREAEEIREYVESQASDEKVTYAEKVATERLLDRKLDAWDVWTDKNRYWVITNPTNLYLQEHFRSLDYLISFHVGVTTRVFARQGPQVPTEQQRRFAAAWRRCEQVAEAVYLADEAEHFQAIGMQCRECLLEFIQAASDTAMVPPGQDAPQRANFVAWSELIAGTVARGESAERIRGYLKGIANPTWDLVNWLTHARNAGRLDAQMAVDATQNVLAAFGAALLRHERGTPDRCPNCKSYRITINFRPDLDPDHAYVNLCEGCGWIGLTGETAS